LEKTRFNSKIPIFFSNYLISKKTQHRWNNFTFSFFDVDVRVGQGSILSPILSTLYLSSIFHIFEKRSNNIKILVLFLSFIDDGFFISQKSLEKNNVNLFCSYNIIFPLLKQFSLAIEYGKSEVFHFSKLHGVFNPSLNLNCIRNSILKPKETWCYLSFIFNRKLFF